MYNQQKYVLFYFYLYLSFMTSYKISMDIIEIYIILEYTLINDDFKANLYILLSFIYNKFVL